MADVIGRLQAANPVRECPPLSIEEVWSRLGETDSTDQPDGEATLFASRRWWRRRSGDLILVASMAATVAFVGLALVLLGHGHTGTAEHAPTPVAPMVSSHAHGNTRLGSIGALKKRLHSLRERPIVVVAWASWCSPCVHQQSLLDRAERRYGRDVVFLGVDTSDSTGAAKAYMTAHSVPYSNYRAANVRQLQSIVDTPVQGLPTTFLINQAGKVVHVHPGSYNSLARLKRDISRYLLPRPRQHLSDVTGAPKMPLVLSQPVAQAKARIAAASGSLGLSVRTRTVRSSAPRDTVVAQVPGTGSRLTSGELVTLMVSNGR